MTTPVTIRELVRSVPRPLECTKIVGGWGFAPDPTEELTALRRPPSWIQGVLLLRLLLIRGGEGRGAGQGRAG